MHLLEQLEQRPIKVRTKDDQERIIRSLTPAEQDMMLDLRPFMQRSPFVVHADANLSRAYRLFRTMGLRHMFVGPPQPKVRQTPGMSTCSSPKWLQYNACQTWLVPANHTKCMQVVQCRDKRCNACDQL